MAKKSKHKTEAYCNKFSKDFKNCPHQNKQTKILFKKKNPSNYKKREAYCEGEVKAELGKEQSEERCTEDSLLRGAL